MHLFVYAGDKKILERLLQKLPPDFPAAQTKAYDTFLHFSDELKLVMQSNDPAVIAAVNHEELEEIIGLKDLIWDLRTILILPDVTHETFASGLFLYPRFISYMDSDFADVAAVLKKMIDQHYYRERLIDQRQIDRY